ncbi:hypothetical protein SAMN05192569_10805 [Parageobacillus thermantarcticus]|uniref:Uncharacterized protein n=1 Tax=Parageobacillus thermantarcticus TaxID=186116 RepID=A0A1I0TY77_9BACL|nr:hypothetical protein SAMN05192569_10805 [Parageobacillus thermantarcticus]
MHRVEGDRLLLRRSFFGGDGKKLPPLHGMKVGEVHEYYNKSINIIKC